jgi:hypothetical protein
VDPVTRSLALRGQAAVETVGLVVVLLLALAATTAWLVHEARPPDRPPQVVPHVARPLGFPDSIRYWALPAVPYGQEGADEPIGDVLRAIGGGGASAWDEYWYQRREWNRVFRRALWEGLTARARAVADDPSSLRPDPATLTPQGLARAVVSRGRRTVAYVEHLRSLPPEERWRALRTDSAEFMAAASLDALEFSVRRGAVRVGAPRTPAPGAPRP